MALTRSLTPTLRAQAQRIEGIARASGLDFFDVVFEALDARDVNAVAAFGGFPVRYPSWRFGMEYERLERGYSWGLSKIYELVINNDPTYAYLVRSNSDMEQKLVMAHVFGHADFFKNNVWFAPTERNMLDQMANYGTRLRRLIDRHGQDKVEIFLDAALSLDNLIDPFLPLRGYLRGQPQARPQEKLVDRARRAFEATLEEPGPPAVAVPVPAGPGSGAELPTYDVLGFLAEHAPLEAWQRDVLRIARSEAYYFMPQRMTKIMNEGWASFWHSRILTGGVLSPGEVIDFADCHSGATLSQPGQLNPYKLGIELFRHAEARGMDIFRLRRVHNDTSFVDEVFDRQFAAEHQLFVYGRNNRTGRTEVLDKGWQEVKKNLLQQLTWGGLPRIELVDVDHEARGELRLLHHHEGRDLELAQAAETLHRVARLWQKPVHLSTVEEGQQKLITSDGRTIQTREVEVEGEDEARDAKDSA